MIRRVLVTGTVTLATLLGSAGLARAADDTAAAPTLSATTVRPGTSFTLTPPVGCPSADGEQGVLISFTDSQDTTFTLSTLITAEDGTWEAPTLWIPVAGVDDTDSWDDADVAPGPGSVDVLCLSSAYVMARPERGGTRMAPAVFEDPDDPDTPNDPDGPGDDEDPGDDDDVTLTYASAPLTVSGKPDRVSVTPPRAEPGDAFTVAPVDACAGTASTTRIQVSPVSLGQDEPEDPGDDGTGDDTVSGLGAEADEDAVLSTELETVDGVWPTTELSLPDDADLGDYAVVVDCLDANQDIISRYQAAPLALGTVKAAAAVCSTKGASVRLSGSYPGEVTTAGDDDGFPLPATVKLSGAGPWTLSLTADLTGAALLKQKIACPEPDYELTVPKTGVSASGAVRARICNTGEADARAVLQVATKSRKWATVDRKLLADGTCAWLDGGKVKKGAAAKAQVLLDPPGQGDTDQEVAKSFTVRRPD